jgi:hypothetical protein
LDTISAFGEEGVYADVVGEFDFESEEVGGGYSESAGCDEGEEFVF